MPLQPSSCLLAGGDGDGGGGDDLESCQQQVCKSHSHTQRHLAFVLITASQITEGLVLEQARCLCSYYYCIASLPPPTRYCSSKLCWTWSVCGSPPPPTSSSEISTKLRPLFKVSGRWEEEFQA
jgi:hypothetical protein